MSNLLEQLKSAIPSQLQGQTSISFSQFLVDVEDVYWKQYTSCSRYLYFFKHNFQLEIPVIVLDIYIRNLGILHYIKTKLISTKDLGILHTLDADISTTFDRYNTLFIDGQLYIIDVYQIHLNSIENYLVATQRNDCILIDSQTLSIHKIEITDEIKNRYKQLTQVNTLLPRVSKTVDTNYCMYCPYKKKCFLTQSAT
ncbi:MAG: hypothetical protein QXI16_05965 [Sulfolobaceae archaeon]